MNSIHRFKTQQIKQLQAHPGFVSLSATPGGCHFTDSTRISRVQIESSIGFANERCCQSQRVLPATPVNLEQSMTICWASAYE